MSNCECLKLQKVLSNKKINFRCSNACKMENKVFLYKKNNLFLSIHYLQLIFLSTASSRSVEVGTVSYK